MVRLPMIEFQLQTMSTDERQQDEAERNLLFAVLQGDLEAERAFVERFIPLIERCVRRLSRSRCSWITEEDIRDIIGEVWVNLWDNDKHRLRRFDPARPVKVSTWVGLLARNKTIDWLRSQQPRAFAMGEQVGELEPDSNQPTPHDEAELRERQTLAGQAMERLNADDLSFMRAWYLDDQDGRELARQLGVAVATVYSRRFKIVAKLARTVEELERRPANRTLN